MKKILILLILALSSPAYSSEIVVTVVGMSCTLCEQGIEKSFKAEPAIAKIDVDLSKNYVQLITKEKQDISNEQITTLIQNSGYSVEKIERK